MVCTKNKLTNTFQVKGLLDFGDAHYSYLIFDIAAAILYAMLNDKTGNYDDEWFKIGECLGRKLNRSFDLAKEDNSISPPINNIS